MTAVCFLHLSEGAFQLSPASVKLKPLLESAFGGSKRMEMNASKCTVVTYGVAPAE